MLVQGFKEGFDIGYEGPSNIKQTAPNLKLTVGDEVDLWNKVMKEERHPSSSWSTSVTCNSILTRTITRC